MTGYTILDQPLVVRTWLAVALLLAVALGAFEAGALWAARPPECHCRMTMGKINVDCGWNITGPVSKVEIKPVDGKGFRP